MTAINTDKCIFCGEPLDAAHQCVCAACVARYKQDHSQEYAEARLRYHLSHANTRRCIVCGQDIQAVKGCVCPLCLESVVDAEVKRHE